MIARVMMLILAFLPLASSAEAGVWENLKSMILNTGHKPPPTIDVLVVNDQPSAMLEVKGKYRIFDPNTKQHISKRYLGKRKQIQTLSSGLKWGEEFPGIFQFQIIPEDGSVHTIVDGVEYKGSIFIYDIGGSISIVNRVPIEEYLSSILPQQYEFSLPDETLAALAITARTNAYYLCQSPKNRFWAVDANHVGYHGLESTKPSSDVEHAIRATRHMVLSKTGTYEGVVTPFAAQWGSSMSGFSQEGYSQIPLYEAEEMGREGKHAAQIISRAFPESHIELIY
ncbi:MAG: hypothetical protein K940chlam7_01070 [Chlamydiae bacterium]|nr:hypothetical protein [Chlamydiota bacterium]